MNVLKSDLDRFDTEDNTESFDYSLGSDIMSQINADLIAQ